MAKKRGTAATDKVSSGSYATFLSTLQSKYGKNSIAVANGVYEECNVIPTGVPSLNIALGVGGWPRGKIVELIGKESSGKSTLAYMSIAKAQHMGLTCALIDVEHSADTEYLGNLSVDCNKLLISRPEDAESALEMTLDMISLGVNVVVIDSVSQLVSRAELNGSMSDSQVALLPRLLSKFLRKAVPLISQKDALVIGVNQLRDKIGSMIPMTVGTGGWSWKHALTIRAAFRSLGKDTRTSLKIDDEGVAGEKIEVEIKKNKVAPPRRKAHFTIVYGQGARTDVNLVDLALGEKIIIGTGVGHYRLLWPDMFGVKSVKDDVKKDLPKLGNGLGGICGNINKPLREIFTENKQEKLIQVAESHGIDVDTNLGNFLYYHIVDQRAPVSRARLIRAFISSTGEKVCQNKTDNKD